MKEIGRKTGTAAEVRREQTRRSRTRTNERCSVCTALTWFNGVALMEPEGAPEPRQSWLICRDCYQMLLVEMRRSPVRSPLRLRIALGIVAAERWPQSRTQSRAWIKDRKLFLFIVWSFIIALILHLALIVMIAAIR